MPSRRGFIKSGTLASIAATSLAGCLNSGESSNGNQVNLTYAPSGFEGIVSRHIVEETDIIQNEMEEVGYELNMQSSWRGPALFASGSADIESIGGFEAARLAVERETPIALNASWSRPNTGAYVKTGSKWSVSETGSIEASLNKLADERGRIGLTSWSLAPALIWQIYFDRMYDLEFSEEDGDFRVQSVELPAVPQLLENEELAMALSGPQYGGAVESIEAGNIEPLFHTEDLFLENDQTLPVYNAWTTTAEFADNHPDAIQALVNAWQKGTDWFFEDPVGNTAQEKNWSAIGAENAEQADWIARWAMTEEMGLSKPTLREDIEMTEDLISADKEFINYGVEAGAIPEGWGEMIEYRTVTPQ